MAKTETKADPCRDLLAQLLKCDLTWIDSNGDSRCCGCRAVLTAFYAKPEDHTVECPVAAAKKYLNSK